MQFLVESFQTALLLIAAFDADVVSAVRTSLMVAFWSVCIASITGIPGGVILAVSNFRLKRLAMTLLNTLMAMPTVVVGLLVYGVISRQGPLGGLGLLFSPAAMVIGQTILALPIVMHYTVVAIRNADPRILPTAATLGAGPVQRILFLVSELRYAILPAIVAAFGRVVAEVGVAMMLGGNIRGYTRTMTTAIAMETGKGEFAVGLALGLILMALALLVNVLLTMRNER